MRTPTFAKEIILEFKSHIDPHTWIEGDFDSLLSPIDRISRQKPNRGMLELQEIINQ